MVRREQRTGHDHRLRNIPTAGGELGDPSKFSSAISAYADEARHELEELTRFGDIDARLETGRPDPAGSRQAPTFLGPAARLRAATGHILESDSRRT